MNKFQSAGQLRGGRSSWPRGGRLNSSRGHGSGNSVGSSRGRSSAADAALHGTMGGGVGRSATRSSGPSVAYRHVGQQPPQRRHSLAQQHYAAAGSAPYWQQQQQQSAMTMMPPPPPPPRPWRAGGSGVGRGGSVQRGRGIAGRQKRFGSGATGGAPTRRRVSSGSSSTAPGQSQPVAASDPLNLRWVAAESKRRAQSGLSPMPGDSALNSPHSEEEQEAGMAAETSDSLDPAADPAAQASVSGGGPLSNSFSAAASGPKFVAIYGNFRADYSRQARGAGEFNIGQMQDDRLQLLQPDWYTGRDVLDIGCNDGILSMRIAEALGVRSLTGLDIDEELVEIAQRNLGERLQEAGKAEDGSSSPPERGGFPYNVTFKAGNYVLDSEADLASVEENKYDVIQAFSITKWIHLNWGDRGLKLFFHRAFKELRPDGKFIVEPQPYRSYQRTLLCPAHKRNFASNIELRPEQFKHFLEREVGFAHIVSVWEQQQCHGFQQPLLLCSKPTGRTPALTREASQHNFRLFVPAHPMRPQLNPSPYQTESSDQLFPDYGAPEDFIDAVNEADPAEPAPAERASAEDTTRSAEAVDDEVKDHSCADAIDS